MGAILGGATDDDARLLYSFGEKIGLAFQLQDDYLDVYGNPEVFGKRIGGDILCNKKTFLLINALQRADINQQAQLVGWLGRDEYVADVKIQAVTDLYNALGIRELCEQRISQYFDEAQHYLDQVSLPAQVKQPLASFAASLVNREN